MSQRKIVLATLVVAVAGCAGSTEQSVRTDLSRQARERSDARREGAPRFDGSVQAYVTHALAESPALAASYARWKAASHRISGARRLPDPMVSYGYFIRSVETRVGPQRHRVGLRQRLPWPTTVSAGGEAAALAARAASERFEAEALAVERRVVEAYFQLWRIRRVHALLSEQDELLNALSDSVRARVEIGQANVGDMAQLDLRVERHNDHRDRHRQGIEAAEATLRAVLGVGPDVDLPTTEDPAGVALPAVDEESLRASARSHPGVTAFDRDAESHEAAADGESARGLPSFELGFDWIETGDAAMPGVQDSGKDPLVVSVAVSVPLWYGTYDDAADARHAEAVAARSAGEAAGDRAEEALMVSLSELRDSARRALLYRNTLLPQAEGAYQAALGGYQAGAADIAQVLWAVSALIEIAVDEVGARADHAIAWARLEHAVGARVARRETSDD